MERLVVIFLGAALSIIFFTWFSWMIKKPSMKAYVNSHLWLLHPNAICYWRTAMAFLATGLYFLSPFQSIAIIIFSFAAVLDGVDGLVARQYNLGTTWGEWLDPMCDKLTYLPPLLGFAYLGILSPTLVWVLVGIELFGQFFARHILALLKTSGAANNFGKIKAIICFILVIFCALRQGYPQVIDLGDEVMVSCIVLAAASIVFKFIPNRLYADLLSTLNFFCGIASLYFAYSDHFAKAIIIIIIGQLFDLFDGRMAAMHGGTKYGPYLDDVADFVSFGLAPAFIIVQRGGPLASFIAIIYFLAVAYRLYRFVAVDKYRDDLPEGIFNGLPSPAGALIVLGASLVCSPLFLWLLTLVSIILMISHIRFAHFGRVIIKKIPRPLFFTASATLIVIIAFVYKTKNAGMFGWLVLAAVLAYLFVGRKMNSTVETAAR